MASMLNYYSKCIIRQHSVQHTLMSLMHRSAYLCCEGRQVREAMFIPFQCEKPRKRKKISVIGAAGMVGVATVATFFLRNMCDEIVMMDINKDKLCGEALDFLHCTPKFPTPDIKICTDFKNTEDSDLIIVAAGITKKKGQTRLDIVHTNAELFKEIIPKVAESSPDSCFLVISNPVDIMTYLTWKYSCFEKNRVLGTGCELDSARFRYLISKRLGISPRSVHGWVIGEHGDSSVPVWSGVNVAGTRLREIDPKIGTKCDPDNWNDLHKQVVKAGYLVHNLKGCTNWAINSTACSIAEAILSDARTVHSVSTQIQGLHGVETETFMSLPAVIGNRGVSEIVKLCLSEEERELLNKSACILDKVTKTVKM